MIVKSEVSVEKKVEELQTKTTTLPLCTNNIVNKIHALAITDWYTLMIYYCISVVHYNGNSINFGAC